MQRFIAADYTSEGACTTVHPRAMRREMMLWGYDPFLSTRPFYYSTFWWDGVPYYYADDNYYVWNGSAGGYQAVDPPPQVLNQSTASAGITELYAYPKNGQSAEQQARDRQEYQTWATQQAALHTP